VPLNTLQMAEKSASCGVEIYVCPACKNSMRHKDRELLCDRCRKNYPIQDGIPDFLLEELAQSRDPELRRMRFIDRLARIYETRLWYPIVLKAYGGLQAPSFAQLVRTVSEKVQATKGRVLDVACGPGTYGRRIASPSRAVFGIDVSMGMLRQGAAYTTNQGIPNVQFARARVEALPFEDGLFDATLCCGSLHLFTDTVEALREMARVMRPGAILVVFTFTAGRGGLLKFRRVREYYRTDLGLHSFDLSELEQCLSASGFTDFQPEVSGSILTFSACKSEA